MREPRGGRGWDSAGAGRGRDLPGRGRAMSTPWRHNAVQGVVGPKQRDGDDKYLEDTATSPGKTLGMDLDGRNLSNPLAKRTIDMGGVGGR